jgi:hypothetical protein
MGRFFRDIIMFAFVITAICYVGLKALDKVFNFTGEQIAAVEDQVTPTASFYDPKTGESVAVRIPADISRSKDGGFTVRMPESDLMISVDDTGEKTFWAPLKGGINE